MVEKQAVGEKAAEFVKDDMIVGLGTGSTVYYTILKLGERVKTAFAYKEYPLRKKQKSLPAKSVFLS